VAHALGPVKRIRVMMCPGEYREAEGGLYGEETIAFLGRFTANRAFISAGGFSGNVITDADPQASWIKRKMIERSKESVLLLDNSKFETQMFSTVCPVADLDAIVLDSPPPGEFPAILDDARVQVHIAS
jgi:DeoR/GlpR family transcriptional regulator of sugar metabolism